MWTTSPRRRGNGTNVPSPVTTPRGLATGVDLNARLSASRRRFKLAVGPLFGREPHDRPPDSGRSAKTPEAPGHSAASLTYIRQCRIFGPADHRRNPDVFRPLAGLLERRRAGGVLFLARRAPRCGRRDPRLRRLPQGAMVARRQRKESSGVRVIYYNRLTNGEIWLLTMYAKSVRQTIPGKVLKKIREAIDVKDDRKGSPKARR